ncbi:hypothetical protein C942_00481 [Photobacterium marinum]|uniref:Uncharacterized protein n=1 Tax=Photobacterium marinum TaxID=1056511 RepID=L8JET1_9GAMM|nr:hypothetical protein [Photobacterium marinum]ELR66039.1 hypothetical protein C942_00481 [Photobacterium marinum]
MNSITPIQQETEVKEEAPVPVNKMAAMAAAAKAKQVAKNEEKAKQLEPPRQLAEITEANNARSSVCKFDDGKTRKKQNYEIQDRKVSVFKSDSLKLAFISTDLAYCTRPTESSLEHVRDALQHRKKVQPLLKADDLEMVLVGEVIEVGQDLNDAKGRVYDLLASEGWKLVCNRPTTSYPRP